MQDEIESILKYIGSSNHSIPISSINTVLANKITEWIKDPKNETNKHSKEFQKLLHSLLQKNPNDDLAALIYWYHANEDSFSNKDLPLNKAQVKKVRENSVNVAIPTPGAYAAARDKFTALTALYGSISQKKKDPNSSDSRSIGAKHSPSPHKGDQVYERGAKKIMEGCDELVFYNGSPKYIPLTLNKEEWEYLLEKIPEKDKSYFRTISILSDLGVTADVMTDYYYSFNDLELKTLKKQIQSQVPMPISLINKVTYCEDRQNNPLPLKELLHISGPSHETFRPPNTPMIHKFNCHEYTYLTELLHEAVRTRNLCLLTDTMDYSPCGACAGAADVDNANAPPEKRRRLFDTEFQTDGKKIIDHKGLIAETEHGEILLDKYLIPEGIANLKEIKAKKGLHFFQDEDHYLVVGNRPERAKYLTLRPETGEQAIFVKENEELRIIKGKETNLSILSHLFDKHELGPVFDMCDSINMNKPSPAFKKIYLACYLNNNEALQDLYKNGLIGNELDIKEEQGEPIEQLDFNLTLLEYLLKSENSELAKIKQSIKELLSNEDLKCEEFTGNEKEELRQDNPHSNQFDKIVEEINGIQALAETQVPVTSLFCGKNIALAATATAAVIATLVSM